MAHSSISMTVDTYGSWLPKSDLGALNRVFATPSPTLGSKVVASGVSEAAGSL